MAALNDQSTLLEGMEDGETREMPAGETTTRAAANEPAPVRAMNQGSVLDRYVIIDRIGAGGFGEVFAAYDPDLDRKIALKLMKTRVNRLGSARAQLLREAQALAKLSHENVTTIYDFGEYDGDVYLSMEFVDGRTLKEWFAEEPRTWQQVRDVMVSAGRGLAAAHSAGIIHSDFKPHNVLVDRRGHVTVADFGLARALSQFEPPDEIANANLPGGEPIRKRRATTIPTVGARSGRGREPIAGSPAYMSPEQFRGQGVDERSDQFAYCVTLFEGLYGRRPFPETNFAELRAAIEEGRMTDPPDESNVPKWLRDVVMRGLSHEAHERYDAMDELLAALSADPEARRRQRLVLMGTAAVSATIALVASTLMRNEPTVAELGHIDGLVVQARASAARSFFVHPPLDAPEAATAYTKILELEGLDGVFDPRADERAEELRTEFADTLTRVGDYYWAAEYGKSFALDYYAQAIIFDPDNARALERSETTPGELAVLRKKAASLQFTRGELIAAEPLAALATDELEDRAERLQDIVERRDRRSSTGQESLETMTKIISELARAKRLGRATVPELPVSDPKKTDTQPPVGVESSGREAVSPAQPPSSSDFSSPLPPEDDEIVRNALSRPPEDERPQTRARDASSKSRDAFNGESKSPSRSDLRDAQRLVVAARKALDSDKFDKAAQLFHRALKSNRRSAPALMGLADAYFEKGDYRRAVEYGERGVSLDPRRRGYRISLGDAYMKVLRYSDAIIQYESAASRGSKLARKRLRLLRKKFGQ